MQSQLRRLLAVIAAAILGSAGIGTAGAAIVTVSGTLFDVRYDDAQLNPLSGQFSLFGAPIISGSNIIFQPNNLFALSTSDGLVSVPATFNLTVIAKPNGPAISGLSLVELGDFSLTGSGSYVNVGGQLIAYDAANFFSYTTNNIAMVSPANTANTVTAPPNVQNANWAATAALSAAQNPLPFANPDGVNVVLENQLQAFAPASDPNSLAFIQKKVTGNTVTLTVTQVPVPAAGLLLAGGFLGLLGAARRRGGSNLRVVAQA